MEFQADRFPGERAAAGGGVGDAAAPGRFRGRSRLEPATDGALATDPARLKQILYNLLSNAIKFTPANGSVTSADLSVGIGRGTPRVLAAESASGRWCAALVSASRQRTSRAFGTSFTPCSPSSHPQTAGNEAPAWGWARHGIWCGAWAARSGWRARSGRGQHVRLRDPAYVAAGGGRRRRWPTASRGRWCWWWRSSADAQIAGGLADAGLRTASAYDGEAGWALAREKTAASWWCWTSSCRSWTSGRC